MAHLAGLPAHGRDLVCCSTSTVPSSLFPQMLPSWVLQNLVRSKMVVSRKTGRKGHQGNPTVFLGVGFNHHWLFFSSIFLPGITGSHLHRADAYPILSSSSADGGSLYTGTSAFHPSPPATLPPPALLWRKSPR